MNEARFNSIYEGLTSFARKVYEAVPISEPWTCAQIITELRRNGLPAHEKRAIDGCLKFLVESGIVKEVGFGTFARAHRPKPSVKKQVDGVEYFDGKKTEPAPNDAHSDATGDRNQKPAIVRLDELATMARRLSSFAAEFSDHAGKVAAMASELADDLDSAAISIADDMKANEEAAKNLRMIQSMLGTAVSP